MFETYRWELGRRKPGDCKRKKRHYYPKEKKNTYKYQNIQIWTHTNFNTIGFRSSCPIRGVLIVPWKDFSMSRLFWNLGGSTFYLANPSGAAGNMLTKTKAISNLLTFGALQNRVRSLSGFCTNGSHEMWFGELTSYEHTRPTSCCTATQAEWWKRPWLAAEKIIHQCNFTIAQMTSSPFFSFYFLKLDVWSNVIGWPWPNQKCPPNTSLQGQDLLLFSGSKAERLWGLCLDDLLAM